MAKKYIFLKLGIGELRWGKTQVRFNGQNKNQPGGLRMGLLKKLGTAALIITGVAILGPIAVTAAFGGNDCD